MVDNESYEPYIIQPAPIRDLSEYIAPDSQIKVINLETNFQSEDEAIQYNVSFFKQIKDHLLANDPSIKKIVVTYDPNSTHGIWCSGLCGLLRTIKYEYPIDTLYVSSTPHGRSATNVENSYKKLKGLNYNHAISINHENTISYNALKKFQRNVHKVSEEEALIINKNDVILAIGGGRGITAKCIIELAKTNRYQFCIIGRTDLEQPTQFTQIESEPGLIKEMLAYYKSNNVKITSLNEVKIQAKHIISAHEIKETMKSLCELGSSVEYYKADVIDHTATAEVVMNIYKNYKKIDALVYGAGIILDNLIKNKSEEDFTQVVYSKIKGVQNILGCVNKSQLKKVILFSSVSSYYGNIGQCDYALANETLNNLASHLQDSSISATAILWPPWEGGMTKGLIEKFFKQQNITPMSVKEGTQYFVDVFRRKYLDVSSVILTNASLHQYFKRSVQ